MSLLHDYFNLCNLQLFQRLLESTGSDKTQSAPPSTSGGKSWKKQHGPLHVGHVDVNGRDWLGRTALHLASASIERLNYVRALLKHPAINVNLPDTESHWTPLHRALYNANLPAAQLLLQHPDIDATLKDNEGYTAFDVYNSTLNGTKPVSEDAEEYADLYTWGTNVNAALGLGDSNDRLHPEHVTLQSRESDENLEQQALSTRFAPVQVKQVEMSRLHTAVVTSESGGNLRVCGFGSGGRLGSSSYTQYTLKPLSQLSQTIVSVALGQDHTLALTKNGEVLSWGLNRFSQLGYPVDPPTSGRAEEPIQYTPRKIQGFLKKEVVKGIAASKCASACWTEESVYTWGTNHGQLGYDNAAQPVQVYPRKVSRLTTSVISITMTENAMACLMQNRQVECFYNNGYYRINFPTQVFPSPIQPYRPPQAIKDSGMAKITSCGDMFASLSRHGEVYIFSPTNSATSSVTNTGTSPGAQDTEGLTRAGGPFKCQRVWALRKKSSAVKDVALGIDGSIIICTESGHVFVRTRNATLSHGSSSNLSVSSGTASQKAFKFQRVPFLQRVIRVCANASGAYGALRVEVPLKDVDVKGELVGQELSRVAPWLAVGRDDEGEDVFGWKTSGNLGYHNISQSGSRSRSQLRATGADSDNEDGEGEEEEEAIEADIRALKGICDAVRREGRLRGEGVKPEEMILPHGADMVVVLRSGAIFPVHKVILAARSVVLERILSTRSKQPDTSAKDEKGNIKISLLSSITRHPRPDQPQVGPGTKSLTQLSISNASPLAVLIVLNYFYSDNVIAVWDRRVSIPVARYALDLKIQLDVGQIRNEILGLARVLGLVDVLTVLERPVKVMLPARNGRPGIVKDLIALFDIGNPLPRQDEQHNEETRSKTVISARAEAAMGSPKALKYDVILELQDREVFTHSVILRARSDLFKSFFDEPDWTRKRWADDLIRINLRHLKWRTTEFVLRFMCCGCDKELFETLEFIKNVDELVEFMFEVMAAANELLLDRLVLLCSNIILTYADFHNACYILAEATHYSATQLTDRIQSYMAANLELFLELHILDDLPQELLVQLACYVQEKQKEKAPFVRGGQLIDQTMARWLDWLEKEDLPDPFVRSNKPWKVKPNVLSIPKFEKPARWPDTQLLRKPPSTDDLFAMDGMESPNPVGPASAWKIHVAPKVDMKAVMAEAALGGDKPDSSKAPPRPQTTPLLASSSPQTGRGTQQTPGSPWKTPKLLVKQPGEEAIGVRLPSYPPSPPSTPQKQKEGSRPSISQRRTPSYGQSPNNTPTKFIPGPETPGPVMGPTITPTKMQPNTKNSLGQRSVSGSGPAWAYIRPMNTISPITATVQSASGFTANVAGPSSSSSVLTPPSTMNNDSNNSKSVSFLAIQHSQAKEQLGDPKKDKRSLVEIQEEEKAKREEETFLRWWEEEEARVKMEVEALEKFKQGSSSAGGGSKGEKTGRGREGGGGRGRGEGDSTGVTDKGGSRGGGKRGPRGGRKEGKDSGAHDSPTPGSIGPSQVSRSDPPTAAAAQGQNRPRPQYRKSNRKHIELQTQTNSEPSKS